MKTSLPKILHAVAIPAPSEQPCPRRPLTTAAPGEKRNRYHLPSSLASGSPVGYRTRLSMTRAEVDEVLPLLSLSKPKAFVPGPKLTEGELFEASSLGVLSSRQSTNYQGFRQVTFGPEDSARIAEILRGADQLDGPVLDGASHTHLVFAKPYRTPFTMLLTFIGHLPFRSLATVPYRAFRKKAFHDDDIPTVGYLVDLHLGILADGLERAEVIASLGHRKANVLMRPFCDAVRRESHRPVHQALCEMAGLTRREALAEGWRLALVAQVGHVSEAERVPLTRSTARKLGANLLSFRSERIQPGVNQEQKAPAAYQTRQQMDVPEELTVQCGRAAYNAFSHWTGLSREAAKEMMMMERVDVLTPGGKDRLREIREGLGVVTDQILKYIPQWADLALGRALSRNAERGRKAFALAGQRIYISGMSQQEVKMAGLPWAHAVRALGASVARASLYAELMGVMELPEGADLLAGVCIMAGPINQNDIGKSFYGAQDLLKPAFPGRNPTSLLVWTLKAKTVADPIGNEQQLLDPTRKGALVDLRSAPHEVCFVAQAGGGKAPLRPSGNTERAFSDQDNFVVGDAGERIGGNEGQVWSTARSSEALW